MHLLRVMKISEILKGALALSLVMLLMLEVKVSVAQEAQKEAEAAATKTGEKDAAKAEKKAAKTSKDTGESDKKDKKDKKNKKNKDKHHKNSKKHDKEDHDSYDAYDSDDDHEGDDHHGDHHKDDHKKGHQKGYKKGKHKLHKAHAHGIAQLMVAVDKSSQLHVNLVIPLESLVGFEYQPKTDKEKLEVENAKKLFADSSKLFALDADLKCQETKSELDFVYKDSHAEGKYHVAYDCKGLGSGKKFTVNVASVFPRIKKIQLQFIPAGGNASSANHKKFPFDIEL